jgi:hypothetical protein
MAAGIVNYDLIAHTHTQALPLTRATFAQTAAAVVAPNPYPSSIG